MRLRLLLRPDDAAFLAYKDIGLQGVVYTVPNAPWIERIHPEMVGVNPEVAHETMAGLNFVHGVAQAWEAGKLFHIDLNDQAPGRYDQDFRFGMVNPKVAFFLVKFLEDVGYDGNRHFDAHAFRTEDYEGVKDFTRGCMRTYLILKEKAQQWNEDREIQALVQEIAADDGSAPTWSGGYSGEKTNLLIGRCIKF